MTGQRSPLGVWIFWSRMRALEEPRRMQSSRLQRSHDGTVVSRLFFLTEFGKPYGAELQGGRGRTAMVVCGLWLGSGVWWYCGITWVIYCRLADCCAEGENGVRKWVRNFRFCPPHVSVDAFLPTAAAGSFRACVVELASLSIPGVR